RRVFLAVGIGASRKPDNLLPKIESFRAVRARSETRGSGQPLISKRIKLQCDSILGRRVIPFSLFEEFVALAGKVIGAARFYPMISGFCAKDCRDCQDRCCRPNEGTALSGSAAPCPCLGGNSDL